MKVVTLKNIPNVPAEGAAERTAGWTGPVSRTRQTIIEPGDSKNYNCSVVNFSQGCNTGWHVHDCDQILIVTSGAGIVATEHEQREINVGDVAHIKAGERRYDHGAHYDHAPWQSGQVGIVELARPSGAGAQHRVRALAGIHLRTFWGSCVDADCPRLKVRFSGALR
jgi:quercetin dioxygenase-like cupin family protein